jgi:hypothetical protein
MHAEKRIRDLEDDVKELEAVNKRLKEELKNYKKKVHRSSKGDIREANEWTGMRLYWPIKSPNSVEIICSLASSF